MKIVIIGYGWVGQANALSLSIMGNDVYYFDPANPEYHYKYKYEKIYSKIKRLSAPTEVDSPDTYYVICVGDRVLPSGEQDISLIKKALDSVKSTKGTIVLRSTIIPKMLKDLQFDFYVPEFLHEKQAVEESLKPQYFVLGKKTNKKEPEFFDQWRKLSHKFFSGTPEEASHIKYLSNLWNSVRIAFVNEYGDSIRTPKTKDDVASIERIIDFIFDGKFYLRYGKAFSGHCLPKDTLSYYSYYKSTGQNMNLLEGVFKSNESRIISQKDLPNLSEWFSAWQKPELSGREALKHLAKVTKKRFSKIFTK
jgi:nucleotide sugar dehydrogenase